MVNPLRIDFDELYQRHLCRHSQFGLNVLHLVAVAGIYVSLYKIVLELPVATWIMTIALLAYLAVLLLNVPLHVWLLNATVVLLLLAAALLAPSMHILGYVALILFFHWFQNWSHKFYTRAFDMSPYRDKYPKGFSLFFTLSLFELPILLNYLAFDRRRVVS